MNTNLIKGSGVLNQTDYTSATVLSTAANFIMNRQEPFTHTFRTYIRLRENGPLQLKFWHSNAVDSTWDQGLEASGSEPGGSWVIESAFIADGGTEPNGGILEHTQHAVTFEGNVSKPVAAGECFWSDETSINLPDGHYLAFTWTIKTTAAGKSIPFNVEGMLATAYDAPGNLAAQESADGFTESDKLLVLPSYIGYKKAVNKKLVFLGDSITQGVRTLKDGYEYWAARIADGLGAEIGVWNLGSGWARAYDVAADGPWLHKAKQSDELMIVLGVNDIDIGCRSADELLGDLTTIIAKIKTANADASIILSTVPPFNFQEAREETWRRVNHEILTNPPAGVDRVFDIASLLSLPAPDDHRIRPEYMSGQDDPHPNGIAGKTVADAFLNWY
ncbi:GDSL-type esterase/lipase family protein [Paenibacillus sp. FSL R5-0636]|uniref:SGNH/GDSL hydrolase family protein n=1 Tax=Paenibacillus TaxID=44249 RepID=UPI0004F84B38|nr:GDSL-type esterase/lipase family protein [Paenibacillus odorifer]AIQ72547.1 GDSL family lipase [Paenibacillus odorifer]OMD05343.1 GDSL family lipase [Paenibacillus odorifer]OZQ73497.1 GDSL family lipase [Paenibacillus odorifer]